MAYFHERIAQSFYHSAYDHGAVNPLMNAAGRPDLNRTKAHWGDAFGGQINDDYTPRNPALFVDGTNAERLRDLGHVSMSMGAWMHAARTILAQNDVIEPHAWARLRAGYAHHADRVLTYLTTGSVPDPQPGNGIGGSAIYQGWLGAPRLFGSDTPADVITPCGRDDVRGFAPAGANHMVAEAYTDAQ